MKELGLSLAKRRLQFILISVGEETPADDDDTLDTHVTCEDGNDDVIDGKITPNLEKEDSLDDDQRGKFRYNQDSLKKHRRSQSKEREKPKRKVSNVVEVDEKLLTGKTT